MVYIHRHSSILRLDLFGVGFALHGECRSNSHSTEVRFCTFSIVVGLFPSLLSRMWIPGRNWSVELDLKNAVLFFT